MIEYIFYIIVCVIVFKKDLFYFQLCALGVYTSKCRYLKD